MLILGSASCLPLTKSYSDVAHKGSTTQSQPSLLREAFVLVDHDMIQAIWEKGQVVLGQDSQSWRKDQCGAWIGREFYGNRESQYGWEIDRIDPKVSDDPANFRPLQWRNDRDRSDGPLRCNVTAIGMCNVDSRR